MQWISETEVFTTEQGRDDFVLMLSVVFREVGQEFLQVVSLRVCQHLLPGRQADNFKKDVGLKKTKNDSEENASLMIL